MYIDNRAVLFLVLAAGLYVSLRKTPDKPMIKPSRRSKQVRYVPQTPQRVESASAGAPYKVFLKRKGRKPKSRYEYKEWLKVNYTTDWKYWYIRYREYREFYDGYAPGGGFFRKPPREKPVYRY